MRNGRVLVVDDDHLVCRCLQRMVDWKGIGCDEPLIAYNGVEAMQIIKREQVDIVISDIKMPMLNGIELCRIINEEYPNIALLILSAYEDFKVAQLALRYDVKGYILKPLNKTSLFELEELVRDLIQHKKHIELKKQIASNYYKEYLEKIIEDNNISALEEFLDKLSMLEKHEDITYSSIWTNILMPISSFRYKSSNVDSKLLLEEERKMNDKISSLLPSERIPYIRNMYKAIMKEKSDSKKNGNIIWEIQNVVKESFASPDLNVNQLGNIFHMSPIYLSNLFVERTGVKLTDYIIGKRLEYACVQLRSSNKSISDIAKDSGYLDASYFARIFRRRIGMTPQEYRKKNQKISSREYWKDENGK